MITLTCLMKRTAAGSVEDLLAQLKVAEGLGASRVEVAGTIRSKTGDASFDGDLSIAVLRNLAANNHFPFSF